MSAELRPRREEDAQRHLAKALSAAGVDFTAALERHTDSYAITFAKPSRLIYRSGIDAAVLEDDASPQLEAVVAEVRREKAGRNGETARSRIASSTAIGRCPRGDGRTGGQTWIRAMI